MTVAAETAVGGYNPYALFVIEATLTDESGREIDCIVSDPDDDDYDAEIANDIAKAKKIVAEAAAKAKAKKAQAKAKAAG